MVFREVLVVEMGFGACWRMVGLAIMAAWRLLLVYEAWWAVCGGRCAFEFFGGVEVGGVCAFGLRLLFYINKYLQRGLLFIYTNKCVRKYLVHMKE